MCGFGGIGESPQTKTNRDIFKQIAPPHQDEFRKRKRIYRKDIYMEKTEKTVIIALTIRIVLIKVAEKQENISPLVSSPSTSYEKKR